MSGGMKVSLRMRLSARIIRDDQTSEAFHALNEIVIDRGALPPPLLLLLSLLLFSSSLSSSSSLRMLRRCNYTRHPSRSFSCRARVFFFSSYVRLGLMRKQSAVYATESFSNRRNHLPLVGYRSARGCLYAPLGLAKTWQIAPPPRNEVHFFSTKTIHDEHGRSTPQPPPPSIHDPPGHRKLPVFPV